METIVEEMLPLFHRLPLDSVTNAHEHELWTNFFTDVDPQVHEIYNSIKMDLNDKDLIKILNDILQPFHACCSTLSSQFSKKQNDHGDEIYTPNSSTVEDPEKSSFWSSILENGLNPRKILSVLFALLRSGNRLNAKALQQEVSILCAKLYFNMLTVPKCGAYRIFQTAVLTEALTVLKPQNENDGNQNKPLNDEQSESDSDAEGGRRRSSFDSVANGVSCLPLARRRKLVADALRELIQMLGAFSMKAYKEELVLIIISLAELLPIFFEPETIPYGNNTLAMNSIAFLVYRAFSTICQNDFHDDCQFVLKCILKELLPYVLAPTAGRQQQIFKEQILGFVKHSLRIGGERTAINGTIFLQQMCTMAPEKSEGRLKMAQMIVSLVNSFPEVSFKSALKFFAKLLGQSKVNYRMTCLEVYNLLLTESKSPHCSAQDSKDFIYHIFCKCKDKSAFVRAKALSVLSHDNTPLDLLLNGDLSAGDSNMLTKMVNILISRSQDDRASVRKAVIMVLERLICLDPQNLNAQSVSLFQELCHDGSVMVRKQLTGSTTAILQRHTTNEAAQGLWIKTVLPLMLDKETSVQEKSLDYTYDVILNNIYSSKPLAWDVLREIVTGKHQNQKGYLKKMMHLWVKDKKIKQTFVPSVQKLINTEYDPVVWVLISNLTSYNEVSNVGFVLDTWHTRKDFGLLDIETLRNLVEIIGNCAKSLPGTDREYIATELQKQIEGFELPARTIETAIVAMWNLLNAQHKNNQKQFTQMIKTWALKVMSDCALYFKTFFRKENSANFFEEEEKLLKHLITVGNVYRFTAGPLPAKINISVQSMAWATIGTSPNDIFSQPGSQSSTPLTVPALIKTEALVTFGKFCLQDEQLAKDSILMFIKELKVSESVAVRNNTVIVLSDFCVRYPSLVEPYVSTMTLCIRDTSSFIRHQTIATLTQLLQEDYIKWKGTLFYRMLSACVDQDIAVSRLSKFCLVHLISKRYPKFYAQHFVRAIYYFNGYEPNTEDCNVPVDEKDEKRFRLTGPQKADKRREIYIYLLNNMSAQEKFYVYPRLCDEILLPITKGSMKLDDECYGVAQDALSIMACDEIKTQVTSNNATEDCLEEAEIEQVQVLNVAVRRAVIENIMPTIIGLKQNLQKGHSPLLKELMLFLKEFLKDFKSEIKEILKADPQLAKEIEHDMKRFDQTESPSPKRPTSHNTRPPNQPDNLQTTPTRQQPTNQTTPTRGVNEENLSDNENNIASKPTVPVPETIDS